jgi:hypothetical protein
MIAISDLRKMAGVEGPCLSVYQPLRDDFSLTTKTDAGLPRAAHLAERLLEAKGLDANARARFLRPIAKIAKSVTWPGRTGAVVIFSAPGFVRASYLPGVVEPRVQLADEFFVLPLLPVFGSRCNFWVLALSTKRTRLLRDTAKRLVEMELPADLARGLVEAGGFDRPDHDLENRSSGGPSNGQMTAIRSGTSTFRETKGQYIRDFFKKIERAIRPILAKSGDPLILAGVPRELAIYRAINRYIPLLDQAIHGSPDATSEDFLHSAALQLMEAKTARRTEEAAQAMETAAGRGLLLKDPDEIAKAAREGQVDHLYMTSRAHANEDLVNHAVLDVVRHSGKVVYAESPRFAGGVAAILRYRATPTMASAAATLG